MRRGSTMPGVYEEQKNKNTRRTYECLPSPMQTSKNPGPADCKRQTDLCQAPDVVRPPSRIILNSTEPSIKKFLHSYLFPAIEINTDLSSFSKQMCAQWKERRSSGFDALRIDFLHESHQHGRNRLVRRADGDAIKLAKTNSSISKRPT